FTDRVAWWNEYNHATPVVIGHYWRRFHPINRADGSQENMDLFEHIEPLHWHGKRSNVFCVDFSVGGRWAERKSGDPLGKYFKLAALRWPEQVLQFDDGSCRSTQGFRKQV